MLVDAALRPASDVRTARRWSCARRGAPDGARGDAAPAGETGTAVLVQDHLRISAELHAGIVGRLFALAMEVYGLAAQVGDEPDQATPDDGGRRHRRRHRRPSQDRVRHHPGPGARPVAAFLPVPGARPGAAGSDLETTLLVQGGLDLSLSDERLADVVSVVREGVAGAGRGAASTVAVRVGVDQSSRRGRGVVRRGHEEAGREPFPPAAERSGGGWWEHATVERQGRRTSWVVRLEAAGPTVRQ